MTADVASSPAEADVAADHARRGALERLDQRAIERRVFQRLERGHPVKPAHGCPFAPGG